MSQRYLSGVQPSGELHLGNYIGAMRHHIEAQDDAYYFIADYHALTSLGDAEALRQNVRHVAAAYLALGLDPARAAIPAERSGTNVARLPLQTPPPAHARRGRRRPRGRRRSRGRSPVAARPVRA